MNASSYLLLRLSIGMSMLGHGLVRLPKLAAFSHWMATSFEKSYLPSSIVLPFSYAVPFIEFILGLLILCGLFTRYALIAGGVFMAVLIFGSTTIENWEAIPVQLIHTAFFAVLLQFIDANKWTLDRAFKKP